VQAAQYQQWLRDTRRFWDVPTESKARFERVCSSLEIDADDDPEALEEIWQRQTEDAVRQITDGIPVGTDWRCLEIGCGVGRLMRAMAPRVACVIGVDLSQRMLDFARDYLAGVPNVELHLNDGRSLDMVPDASIDFVYSHLAFQHITLYEVVDAYLADIARVLKPGGYCRIQNWREGPIPAVERAKNIVRALLGREILRSNRCWQWREGKCVRFGGVTFTPRQWRRRLQRFGLRTIRTQLGLGHEYWMWTTSRAKRTHRRASTVWPDVDRQPAGGTRARKPLNTLSHEHDTPDCARGAGFQRLR